RDALKARGLRADLIRACLPVSAPFDLRSEDPVRRQKVAAFLASPNDVEAASPIAHVEGNRTPFLVPCGSADLPELIPQASRMTTALADAGARADLLMLEGRNHFNTHEDCGMANGPWVQRARTLLRGA